MNSEARSRNNFFQRAPCWSETCSTTFDQLAWLIRLICLVSWLIQVSLGYSSQFWPLFGKQFGSEIVGQENLSEHDCFLTWPRLIPTYKVGRNCLSLHCNSWAPHRREESVQRLIGEREANEFFSGNKIFWRKHFDGLQLIGRTEDECLKNGGRKKCYRNYANLLLLITSEPKKRKKIFSLLGFYLPTTETPSK
jgi:hypothetical protein